MNNFEFMLCEEDKPENLDKYLSDDYLLEEKIDGTRAILINTDKVNIINRNGISYGSRFPELIGDVSEMPKGIVLDCEIVASFKGVRRFEYSTRRCATESKLKQQLLAEIYPIKLIVFDILVSDNVDIRKMPLIDRKRELSAFFDENFFRNIQKIETYWSEEEKKGVWSDIVKNDLEGVVVKNLNSAYIGGRSSTWKKIKNTKSVDLKFTSYEQNNKGITLISDKGIRVQCSGFQSREVKERIDREGYAIAEINYLGITDNSVYRMPTFKGLK